MTGLWTKPKARGWVALGVLVGMALAVGAVAGWATASSVATWYASLNKPPFNPPNWVFAPVWTALYLTMAVAAWRVWQAAGAGGRRRTAMAFYGAQLALNFAWSLIFFGLRRPGLALLDIGLLLAAVVACAAEFWRTDKTAGAMMVPYAAWVMFAATLNFEIWRLN